MSATPSRPDLVIDGQLHELGPRSDVEVEDPAVKHRLLTELTLSTMDAVGVDAAVVCPMDEDWAEGAVAEFPDRLAAVIQFDPDAPDLDERIAAIGQRPGVVGVRVLAGFPMTGENIERLDQGGFDATFAACERHGVPLFLFISGDLPRVPAVAERFPDLRLIVDHLGIRQHPIDVRDDPPFATLPDLLALAAYPNVAVKLCGVPALSEDGWPFADVWPALHQVLDAFGVDRLFWASDIGRFQGRLGWDMKAPNAWEPYPGRHTYAESLNLFLHSSELSDSDRAALLGGTISAITQWQPGRSRQPQAS